MSSRTPSPYLVAPTGGIELLNADVEDAPLEQLQDVVRFDHSVPADTKRGAPLSEAEHHQVVVHFEKHILICPTRKVGWHVP